jgi:hypothetical protein
MGQRGGSSCDLFVGEIWFDGSCCKVFFNRALRDEIETANFEMPYLSVSDQLSHPRQWPANPQSDFSRTFQILFNICHRMVTPVRKMLQFAREFANTS